MSARSPHIRTVFVPAALLLAILLTAWLTYYIQGNYRTLRVRDTRFLLTVADTDSKRAKGLGGRKYMSQDQGMLFVYDQPGKQCFWMKDMHFALDIVWMDVTKKVVHIARTVRPETYPHVICPAVPAQYVIELRAGQATSLDMQTGDTLSF